MSTASPPPPAVPQPDRTPLSTSGPARPAWLKDLQGNILKGHGRQQTRHLLLRFTASPERLRRWVSRFANDWITTADRQLEESDRFNRFGTPGGVFASVFLSSSGYRAMDIHELPADPQFRGGMKASRQALEDSDPACWEEPYRQTVDAMILLADDDDDVLSRITWETQSGLSKVATILGVEHGRCLRNRRGEVIEHFGFVDCRSHPVFFSTDLEVEARAGGTNHWDPLAPLDIVLVNDPAGPSGNFLGSYFVFRKLEQNVRGFKQAEQALAAEMNLPDQHRERAGALIMGRFRDGTALTLHPDSGGEGPVLNNFNYEDDKSGAKCPFHAHIRKSNPRGDTTRRFGVPLADEKRHLIIRRGITYGIRDPESLDFDDVTKLPTGGVGLLFMCYQASLRHQFEFIQAAWTNSKDFANPGTGVDPVTGQGLRSPLHWPTEWGKADSPTVPFSFEQFVTLLGGEYFFVPSMPFFRGLAG